MEWLPPSGDRTPCGHADRVVCVLSFLLISQIYRLEAVVVIDSSPAAAITANRCHDNIPITMCFPEHGKRSSLLLFAHRIHRDAFFTEEVWREISPFYYLGKKKHQLSIMNDGFFSSPPVDSAAATKAIKFHAVTSSLRYHKDSHPTYFSSRCFFFFPGRKKH